MKCQTCLEDKSTFWFDSDKECLSCELKRQADDRLKAHLTEQGFQVGDRLKCMHCQKSGSITLFREEQHGYSNECKICEMIKQRKAVEEQNLQKTQAEFRKTMEAIPLVGYERNKKERYTILCTRCKVRKNPEKVRILGAICEDCWLPNERVEALAMHKHWNKSFKGDVNSGIS